MTGKKPSREAIAWEQIGSTAIGRRLAVLLSCFFLVAVFAVPLGQYALDRSQGTKTTLVLKGGVSREPGEPLFSAIDRTNNAVLEGINHLETTLEEQSFLRKTFLPSLQYVLLRFLGKGNEKAIPGRDGWLHFAPAIDSLIGPPFLDPVQLQNRREGHKLWEKPVQPDPLAAIVDFKNQLAARGTDLIIVPVPVKAAIQPERLSARSVPRGIANRSWPYFVQALQEHGVQLYDARPVLSRYAEQNGDAYLTTDTHWLPGAMRAVAEELAALVASRYPRLQGKTAFTSQQQMVSGLGDIARMLTLPEQVSLYPSQEVPVQQILTGQQEFWLPDRGAEILLLGDSFTNIYSADGLGWGMGAGFAEQLSHFLQTPLDLLARNDSGAYVTREMLAAELARGRNRLAGKKLVIWQFSERELAVGDWRSVALQLETPGESGYYAAETGGRVRVKGVVGSISRSARPGSVPYRDNIVTMHLVDLEGLDGQLKGDQAVVYGWGMRDNQLTSLAPLRPGDTVFMTLVPWEDVEGEYGSYRRTPLDDQMTELEMPNWGTLNDDKQP